MPDYNSLLHTLTKGIDDIAETITSSSFYKDVIPGRDGFAEELYHQIRSNERIRMLDVDTREALNNKIILSADKHYQRRDGKTGSNMEKEIQNEIRTILENGKYTDSDLERVAALLRKHKVSNEEAEKFKKTARKKIDSTMEDIADGEMPEIRPGINDILGGGLNMNPLERTGLYAQTYFNNPDAKVKQRRIAAVAGTYAGVAIGGRLLSGGGLTHDNYGRRDIAGIPFI